MLWEHAVAKFTAFLKEKPEQEKGWCDGGRKQHNQDVS